MLRKSLRVIGWIAAGLVTLCVVAYLAALAINWHDQPPNATAIRLAQMFRDRPAIADEDNAYAYLRSTSSIATAGSSLHVFRNSWRRALRGSQPVRALLTRLMDFSRNGKLPRARCSTTTSHSQRTRAGSRLSRPTSWTRFRVLPASAMARNCCYCALDSWRSRAMRKQFVQCWSAICSSGAGSSNRPTFSSAR